MKYIEEIESRKASLSAIIKKALAQLKNAPEGQLRIRMDNKRPRYYCRRSGKDVNGYYISCKGEGNTLVRRLAQKKYAQKVLRAAEDELTTLERGENYILSHLPEIKADEVFDYIAPAVRDMTIPIVMTDEQFARQWQSQTFENFDYFEEEKTRITKRGE